MIERKTVSQCVSSDYCKGWNDAVDAMPKWISVEERLPKESGRYIVRFPSGNIDSVTYSRMHNAFNASDMLPHKNNAMTVTHWMPLPSAPEVSE